MDKMATKTARVRVNRSGTLSHEGRILNEGEIVEVRAELARQWTANGLASEPIRIRALKEGVQVGDRVLAEGEEWEADEPTALRRAAAGAVQILNPRALSSGVAPSAEPAIVPKPEAPKTMYPIRSLVADQVIGGRVCALGEVGEAEEEVAIALVAKGRAEGVGLNKLILEGLAKARKRAGFYCDGE